MKTNILAKVIMVFAIISVVAIGLKIGDNIVASSKASLNEVADRCGVNNGYLWNGTDCVRYCDASHPWDPVNKRCSGAVGYAGSTYVSGQSTDCARFYGSNFYFNGTNCVQRVAGQNYNYANNYNQYYNQYQYTGTNQYNTGYLNNNGYTYTEYYPNTYHNQTYSYTHTTQNTPRVNESIIYYNTYNYIPNTAEIDANNAIYRDIDQYPFGRGSTNYYVTTITNTSTPTNGTPIYLGGNYNNGGYNWFNSYDYNYSYSSDYNYSSYYNSGYEGGYYDIYGNYRY